MKLSDSQWALLQDLPSNGVEAASFWNKDKRLRTYRSLLSKGLADSFGAITPKGIAALRARGLQENGYDNERGSGSGR